jgi:hypothetical protein
MRALVVLAVGIGWVGTYVACVGDTASTGGSKGGPCYPNQTCDPGLVCENGACFVSTGSDGGGTDSASDTSAPGDGATDAGKDVQTLACAYTRTPNNQPACNAGHCLGNNCCVGTNAESCQAPCLPPDFSLGCDETADCTANDAGAGRCGIVVQTTPAPTCPVTIQVSPGGTTNCTGAGLILCAADGDCPSGSTCVSAAISIGQLVPHDAGVCYPFN